MATTNYESSVGFQKDIYLPAFDPTGLLVANKVIGEVHTITAEAGSDFHVIVPLFGPFFADGLSISFKATGQSNFSPLVLGLDYVFSYQFMGASRACAKPIYGGISLLNNQMSGQIRLNTYQSLGGSWVLNMNQILEILANQIQNPKITSWEVIANVPTVFPPQSHEYNLTDQVGASSIVQAIELISAAIANKTPALETGALAAILDHISDPDNPHDQYVTEEELAGLLQQNDFKGAYIGIANLTNTTYSLPNGSPYSDNLGIFTARFNQTNPANALLQLPNGTAKPLTDLAGRPLPPNELVAGEDRICVSTGDRYSVLSIKRYLSIDGLGTTAFNPVAQNDAVRFNSGLLAKAIASGAAPDNSVIGFADKAALKVVYSGLLSGFADLTVDAVYYLSDTQAGRITTTKPKSDAIIVGKARSATELFVGIMAAPANETVPIGGGDDKLFFGNDKVMNENFTLPENKNYMMVGNIDIGDADLVIPDTTDLVIY